MAELDRRTVIKGALAAGALLSRPSAARAAALRPSVFVGDSRFLPSAVAALECRKLGAAVIDARLDDLGIAWRRRIPDLLKRNGASVAGVTLWSDLLICEMFARGHGLMLVNPTLALAAAGDAGLHYWMLSASSPAGEAAGALGIGPVVSRDQRVWTQRP